MASRHDGVDMKRQELDRHQHLQGYRVDVVKGELVVYEPSGGMTPALVNDLSFLFGMHPAMIKARQGGRIRTRYSPVMKFTPADQPGSYVAHRMTYRGEGEWSWPLMIGPLRKLVKACVGKIGTDDFYELM